MARVLTVRRVRVSSAHAQEYQRTVATLAARLEARGQHLWLFRHRSDDGSWLEFSEGPDDASHRSAGPVDAGEAALEAALLRLAESQETDCEIWDEVRPLEM
jgi:hypothetical protein